MKKQKFEPGDLVCDREGNLLIIQGDAFGDGTFMLCQLRGNIAHDYSIFAYPIEYLILIEKGAFKND